MSNIEWLFSDAEDRRDQACKKLERMIEADDRLSSFKKTKLVRNLRSDMSLDELSNLFSKLTKRRHPKRIKDFAKYLTSQVVVSKLLKILKLPSNCYFDI